MEVDSTLGCMEDICGGHSTLTTKEGKKGKNQKADMFLADVWYIDISIYMSVYIL